MRWPPREYIPSPKFRTTDELEQRSCDLRTPLRTIGGFSQALLEDYGDVLDAQGQDWLGRVQSSAQRMGQLIELAHPRARRAGRGASRTGGPVATRTRHDLSLGLREDDDEPVTEVGLHQVALDAAARRAPKPDRGLLLRMDGVHAGQVHVLSRSTLRIGRHQKNDIHIDDSGISRFHACIEWEKDRHRIENLESRNGTSVSGAVVTRKELSDGDWIQLGPRVCFRYSWSDADQEELLRRMYESSTRDALTGAYKRRHFEERLNAEIAYALRHNGDVALILFDIDHFKRVNDSYGHQAGDAVLRQLAATAARRLRKPIPVTISAGCSSLAFCSELSANALIATADRRLYGAKGRGRNRVVASD